MLIILKIQKLLFISSITFVSKTTSSDMCTTALIKFVKLFPKICLVYLFRHDKRITSFVQCCCIDGSIIFPLYYLRYTIYSCLYCNLYSKNNYTHYSTYKNENPKLKNKDMKIKNIVN